MKKLCCVLALLLVLLCGCGGPAEGESVGTCTVSIECYTVLDHMDELTAGKEDLIPEDGVMLATTTVELQAGDSVYSLLQRFFQAQKMHYEFVGAGSSAYLAGVNNLYEFDCGSLSGWEYTVNGEFPTIGLGGYELQDGDVIELLYTCDLGADVGDHMGQ